MKSLLFGWLYKGQCELSLIDALAAAAWLVGVPFILFSVLSRDRK